MNFTKEAFCAHENHSQTTWCNFWSLHQVYGANLEGLGDYWLGPWGNTSLPNNGLFDLDCLANHKSMPRLSFRGPHRVKPGIYAVVEVACFKKESPSQSQIFCPIFQTFSANNPQLSQQREYFLANVEAIVDTVAVIPNIGCPPKNRYFMLQPHCK